MSVVAWAVGCSGSNRELVAAVEQNAAAAVRQAMRNKANVNCVSDDATPLTRACQRGYDDIVRILLKAGANARWMDCNGCSAISHARHLSIVEMLLNHDNGLLEISDYRGQTPLFLAIDSQRTNIVQLLLDRGANVQAKDVDKMTALMLACQQNNVEIMRLLLAAQADPHARDYFQQTALHHAVVGRSGELALRELIQVHNADMFAVDKNGCTPFDVATRDVADCLLQLYGDKMTRDHGRLALHTILRSAEYSFVTDDDDDDHWHPPLTVVHIRLPLGTLKLEHFRTVLHNLDTLDSELIWNRDDSGKLPIHIACESNVPVEVMTLIVEMDPATLRIADHRGSLPLHLLCCSGTTPTDDASVQHLVQQGGVGTLAVRNQLGDLPIHNLVASTNPTLRTVQYLIQSFPGSVTARSEDEGPYPFMAAACDTSSASLSVVYELVRASPALVLPR